MSFGNRARYAAALQDCEELLNRLETKPKVDFEVFAEVWRDMTFSLIFCGRTSEEDLLDFTDDLFLAAKSCWLPPNNTTRRLLAAYLIYGLYFKQPAKNACKFKITKKDWHEISEYFTFIKKKNLHEHYYMFCKLIESDAFCFCATPYEVNLDRRTRGSDVGEGSSAFTGGGSGTNTLEQLVSQGFFENIKNIEAKFEQAKSHFIKTAPELAGGLANMGTKDLGQKLRGLCLKHTMKEEHEKEQGTSEFVGNVEVFPDETAIGKRRVALKQRTRGTDQEKAIAEESAWSTEDEGNEAGEAPRIKRRRRERGYHMVKNFRQRDEMRFVHKDDNYHFHSKSSRTLHNDPMHNFMAATRPRGYRRVARAKPSLDYLARGKEFALQAMQKHGKYRTQVNEESKTQQEEEHSEQEMMGESDGNEIGASFVITGQNTTGEAAKKEEISSEISGTLSTLSLGMDSHETCTEVPNVYIKTEASPETSNSSVLDMPLL